MPIIGVPIGGIAPVTFLTLTRRLAQECGATTDPVTAIPTLSGATGEIGRLANWIQNAWIDIQGLHTDWRFMRRSTSFETIEGQATYTALEAGLLIDAFGSWDLESFRSYPTSATITAEMPMTSMLYDAWRNRYQLGALRDSKSQPSVITETPDGSLGLGPVPLVGYTVSGDYYHAPIHLETDGDTPALPTQHSKMLIVYHAMLEYGDFEVAGEVYKRARRNERDLLFKLECNQLPPVLTSGALA